MSTKRFERMKKRTYEALLNSGLGLILKHGYNSVSVADIAREADYGRSTFYLYFTDKEDLAFQLLMYQTNQLDQYLIDAVGQYPHPRREWEAWRMIVHSVEHDKQFFLQMDGDVSRRLLQQRTFALHEVFEKNLRSKFIDYGLDVPVEFQARFLVGATQDVLEYWLVHPELGDADTVAAYFYEMLFRQKPQFNDNSANK
jgi:AcrR family transcriptional regulator